MKKELFYLLIFLILVVVLFFHSSFVYGNPYFNNTGGFDISQGTNYVDDGVGVTRNGSNFWIMDSIKTSVFCFYKDGTYINGCTFQVQSSGADNPSGITTNGSDFWFLDRTDDFVYHFAADETNLSDGFFVNVASSGIDPTALYSNESDFWIVGIGGFIYHFYKDGTNMTGGFNVGSIGLGSPRGITKIGDDFWIVDDTSNFVYHFNSSGDNQTGGFDLTDSSCTNPFGITTNDSDFWVVDESDDFLYHFSPDYSPQLSIIFPINDTTTADPSLDINYTFSDDRGVDSCWYSNDSGVTNSSLDSTCTNITAPQWGEGIHNVTIWINDSSDNKNSSTITFTIDTPPPNVSIAFPVNNSNYSSSNLDINYTVIDSDLDSCWYSNDSGVTNSSADPTCSNLTTITWGDGSHNVTLWANDSWNDLNWSSVFFTIDTTNPSLVINEPNDSLTYISTTININITASDTHLDSCFFNMTVKSTGVSAFSNTEIENCHNTTAILSGDGIYAIWVTVNDSFSNINITNSSFTITQPGTPSTGGGGGGTSNLVSVIAIIKPVDYQKIISGLNRAIIYARIRDACRVNSKITSCNLNEDQKQETIEEIESQGIGLNKDEFNLFFINYQDNELEDLTVRETDADRYNLFKSTLEVLESPFKVSPIDTFFFIINSDTKESIARPNKIIESCEVLNGELGWECIPQETTALIRYTLQDFPPDFFAKTIPGTITFVSEEKEVYTLDVQFRAIYLLHPNSLIIGGVLIGLGILFYFQRKKIKKLIKKTKLKKIFS